MPWDEEEQREISRRRWFVKHWFGRPYIVSNPEVEMEEPRREIVERRTPVRLGNREYIWRNYEVDSAIGEGIRDRIYSYLSPTSFVKRGLYPLFEEGKDKEFPYTTEQILKGEVPPEEMPVDAPAVAPMSFRMRRAIHQLGISGEVGTGSKSGVTFFRGQDFKDIADDMLEKSGMRYVEKDVELMNPAYASYKRDIVKKYGLLDVVGENPSDRALRKALQQKGYDGWVIEREIQGHHRIVEIADFKEHDLMPAVSPILLEHGTTSAEVAARIRKEGLKLFPARNPVAANWPESAFVLPRGSSQTSKAYSEVVEGVLSPGAKVLYERSPDFRNLAKGIKNPTTSGAVEVTHRAKAAGYDVVAFERQDIGWVVLNEKAVDFTVPAVAPIGSKSKDLIPHFKPGKKGSIASFSYSKGEVYGDLARSHEIGHFIDSQVRQHPAFEKLHQFAQDTGLSYRWHEHFADAWDRFVSKIKPPKEVIDLATRKMIPNTNILKFQELFNDAIERVLKERPELLKNIELSIP